MLDILFSDRESRRLAYGKEGFMPFFSQLVYFNPIRHKGIKLGWRRLSMKQGHKGVLVVAPTGMGKSTMYSIPQLLSLVDSGSSVVITDPAGEAYDLCAGYLSENGYRIMVFNPDAIDRSLGYNPLCLVKGPVEAAKIADTLIYAANDKGKQDQFWLDGASNLLSILIQVLSTTQEKQYFNLANLRYMLNSLGDKGQGLAPIFTKVTDPMLKKEIEGFVSQERKVFSSFVSTASVAMKKIADPSIAKLTSGQGEQLDISALRKEKTAIFLQTREDRITHHSYLLQLLTTHVLESLMEMPKEGDLNTMILLEEAGNIPIKNLAGYATTLRKRKTSLALIIQDIEQLTHLYGDETSALVNGGLVNRIYFPGLSNKTCQEIEKAIGQREQSFRSPGTHGRWQVTARPVMRTSEIRTMKTREVLYLAANQKAVKIRLTPWYKSRKMKRLCNKPTPKCTSNLASINLHFFPIPQESENNQIPTPNPASQTEGSEAGYENLLDNIVDEFEWEGTRYTFRTGGNPRSH